MYYGAYEGYALDNKLRSLNAKGITGGFNFIGFHEYCKNNGTGYEMECFSKRWYILGLLILVSKARDIPAVIGYGRCGNNSSSNSTGLLNSNGLFYGRGSAEKYNTYSVKCFGIENMWGNRYKYINGLCTLSSTAIGLKGTAPYNDSGSGYTSITDGYPRNESLYVTDMIPVLSGAGMVASAGQSDYTKGFCDFSSIKNEYVCVPYTGGSYSGNWFESGPFTYIIYITPSASQNFGARIIYA